MKKKLFLVFDTETTEAKKRDHPQDKFIYNIGWVLCDKKGNIKKRVSLVIKEVFLAPMMNYAFFNKNKSLLLEEIASGDSQLVSFKEALDMLNDDAKLCDVLAAYNIKFDIAALKSTQAFTCCHDVDLSALKSLQRLDIWAFAGVALPLFSYLVFCENNGLKSEKGNYKSSADAVGKFIYHHTNGKLGNDKDEEHRALQDCELESSILTFCYKQRVKVPKNAGNWQQFQPRFLATQWAREAIKVLS